MCERPPPVLTGLYVVAYAHVDDSIVFEQRFTQSVDGQWLDRVPNIAICQDFDTREFAVQYCDADWELLSISGGHRTAEEAKARAERSYHGLAAKWTGTHTTFEAAKAVLEAEIGHSACSFCGKPRMQVSMMFGEETRICNECVFQFHRILHTG